MGGALGGGGRPPKREGSRRSHHRLLAQSVSRRLPASGRKGPTPPWPFSIHIDPKGAREEAALWRRMWKKPQALVWELQGMELAVARWVRLHVDWQRTTRSAGLAELRALDDRLGLTPLSLLRLGWSIEDQPVEDVDTGPKLLDIRDRLKAN
jgi:hypothetical protein